MTPQEVLEYAKTNDAKQLDLRFTDIPGLQHHVSYPVSQLDESSFEEGFGMDGSSIDRKSTRLNSSHLGISYAVFCLKKNRVRRVNEMNLGLSKNFQQPERMQEIR